MRTRGGQNRLFLHDTLAYRTKRGAQLPQHQPGIVAASGEKAIHAAQTKSNQQNPTTDPSHHERGSLLWDLNVNNDVENVSGFNKGQKK